jgi:hypothetical protein
MNVFIAVGLPSELSHSEAMIKITPEIKPKIVPISKVTLPPGYYSSLLLHVLINPQFISNGFVHNFVHGFLYEEFSSRGHGDGSVRGFFNAFYQLAVDDDFSVV